MEKTVGSKWIHRGKILNLREELVSLPDGSESKREIVEHPGSAAVVPLLPNGRILLVRQFRKAVEDSLIEIPAGKLDKNESPAECALRELEEETGFRAGNLYKILDLYSSPGYSDESVIIFQASDLQKTAPRNEPDEFIETVEVEREEALEMIKTGRIKDAKTAAGILAVFFLT